MKIHLIAVGTRMPEWVSSGYQEYAKRLPPECRLHLHEIAAGKRGKSADIARVLKAEGEAILAKMPANSQVIALDVNGRTWDTATLAKQLDGWMQDGRDIVLLVGGPEGLSDACKQRAQQSWSLSSLTMPHPLVRVVVAEALYRAWSLLSNHPYHRE